MLAMRSDRVSVRRTKAEESTNESDTEHSSGHTDSQELDDHADNKLVLSKVKSDIPNESSLASLEGDLICNECMCPFATRSKLNRHIREQHSDMVKMEDLFHCRGCRKSFRRKEHMKRHEKACHLGDKLQCPLCPSRFVEKCRLMKHLLEKHEVYKCQHCNGIVKSRNARDHNCEEGLRFPEPQFQCKFCDKRYRRKGYLVKHLEEFHGPQTNNKFTEVVNELQRLETPWASCAKSAGSELYEYEIGLEYDVDKGKGPANKVDIFSGTIKLPRLMSYLGNSKTPTGLLFGRFELGKRDPSGIAGQILNVPEIQFREPTRMLEMRERKPDGGIFGSKPAGPEEFTTPKTTTSN